MAKSLGELFTIHGSDKDRYVFDGSGHSYGNVYAVVVGRIRNRLTAVLEVGVLGGASLRAWREWVPESCRVVGIDINLTCGEIAGVELHQCDSRDADSVRAAIGDATFDLIVDDGGHGLWEQSPTWDVLFPRLNPGGIYVVEDLQHPETREHFARLGCAIFDHAAVTGKFDDALAVFHKPAE